MLRSSAADIETIVLSDPTLDLAGDEEPSPRRTARTRATPPYFNPAFIRVIS